jgi:N-acetylneuraminic acid mutarotase
MVRIMGALRATLIVFLILCSLLVSLPNIAVVKATADSWTTKASMPKPQIGLRAAVVNGKIYAIGGAVNYEYDPAADTWTTKTPMPTERQYFGIAVYRDKIYTIGGSWWDPVKEGRIASNANEVYDPLTDTWETREPMPTNRSSLRASEVNCRIYLMGGRTGGQKTTVALNEVYDPVTDSWTTKEEMPYPVVGYASAVVNGKIHVIGGQNEFHDPDDPINTDHNQIYNPENDTWSLGAPLPTVVLDAGAGATTGINAPKRIYVIGGLPGGGGEAIKITQAYDPEKDSWEFCASMPTARAWLAVAVVDDVVYAIGGSSWLFLPKKAVNEQYTPIKFGTIEPIVQIVSPENRTYPSRNVPLVFKVNKPVVWMGYSIDGKRTVTISGNITLSGPSGGVHNITILAKDEFNNIGTSETIIFSIAAEPFPTTLVLVASVVIVTLVGVGLLIYFKKRKH